MSFIACSAGVKQRNNSLISPVKIIGGSKQKYGYLRVVQSHPVRPLHHQHFTARQTGVYLEHEHVWGHPVESGEPLRAGGLCAIVELAVEQHAEVIDYGGQVKAAPQQRRGVLKKFCISVAKIIIYKNNI